MSRKLFYVGVGLVAVVIAATAYLYLKRSTSLSGAIIDPPWAAPAISLSDQNGSRFSLGDQHGKVVLLYFGYTNCPDECPLTMAHLKLAVQSLGAQAKDVQVAMVSTDPERDTPQALKEFMGKFDPSFVGLTGAQAQLQQTWQEYGVAVDNGGATHSTFIYVIDPAGNIRETFLPDSSPTDIAADVSLLLKGR